MIKIIKLVALNTFVLLLAACGSSDSPNTTDGTDSPATHSLAKLQTTNLGVIYTAELTGSDSDGVIYNIGNITITNPDPESPPTKGSNFNLDQTMYNGVLVNARITNIYLTNDALKDSQIPNPFMELFDESGNLLALEYSIRPLCTPAEPDRIPVSVNVGDSGMLSTLTCDDESTTERSWSIEDAGNGNIKFITTSTKTSSKLFNPVPVTENTFIINAAGDIVEFSGVLTIPSSVKTKTGTDYTRNYSTDPLAPKTPVNVPQ